MPKIGIFKLSLILVLAMLVTACGGKALTKGERIAVVNWTKAVEGHPSYEQVKKSEKSLKALVNRREQQAALARTQLNTVGQLQALKMISKESYYQADFSTKMAEQQVIAEAKLKKYTEAAEKEADAILADEKQKLEQSYQLELFNLRLELENAKRPHLIINEGPRIDRKRIQELEAKLKEVDLRKSQDLAMLEMYKHNYVNNKRAVYFKQLKGELDAFAQKKLSENRDALLNEADDTKELAGTAPKALSNALAIMDKEIDTQQSRIDKLKKQINLDIESAVLKLVKERGYSIVFNTYKVNVKAEDITDEVLIALRKMK